MANAGSWRSLKATGPSSVYLPSGHILYRRNPVASPSIWALPFSPETLTANGEPFLIERSGQGMSLSEDGTLTYLDTGRVRGQQLAWRDPRGRFSSRPVRRTKASTPYRSPRMVIGWSSCARRTNRAFWLDDVQRFGRTRFDLGTELRSETLVRDLLPIGRRDLFHAAENAQRHSHLGQVSPTDLAKHFPSGAERIQGGRGPYGRRPLHGLHRP